MSYNINTWKTKKLENFSIELDAFYEMDECEVVLGKGGYIKVTGPSEGFEVTGKLVGDRVLVHSIESWGEGSGWAMEAMKVLLAHSTGTLLATLVWEGGDSIERLTVIDGVVTEVEADI